MGPHKKTPAQKEQDRIYRKAFDTKAKANTKAKRDCRAAYMRDYRARQKTGPPSSISFSFRTDKKTPTQTAAVNPFLSASSAAATPAAAQVENIVPPSTFSAPAATAPAPAATMTPYQLYNLEMMKLQAQVYESGNTKIASLADAISSNCKDLATDIRSNCESGVARFENNLVGDNQEVNRALEAQFAAAANKNDDDSISL